MPNYNAAYATLVRLADEVVAKSRSADGTPLTTRDAAFRAACHSYPDLVHAAIAGNDGRPLQPPLAKQHHPAPEPHPPTPRPEPHPPAPTTFTAALAAAESTGIVRAASVLAAQPQASPDDGVPRGAPLAPSRPRGVAP